MAIAGDYRVLRVFNTLTRLKEEFAPIRGNEVRMYVYSPTVYDYIHIGNARSFVAFDVIRRYLEYKGYKVTYVSNLTDIDDKTIRRSGEMGISLQQLGEKFSDAYFEDITKLNVKRPDINPRATNTSVRSSTHPKTDGQGIRLHSRRRRLL